MSPQRRRLRTVLAALVLTSLGIGAAPTVPAAASGLVAYDVTSAQERRRVDAVPTPVLHWWDCDLRYRCTTVPLPLDYDDPQGPQVEVALRKLPARTPAHRIGTLFLNPGGPGTSGADFVFDAGAFLSPQLLDRFDLVGFDPRGVGASDALRCFGTPAAQAPVLTTLRGTSFPYGAAAQRSFLRAESTLGRACSTTGAPLSVSMSTAETARDLDVLRRAVGDRRLSYLGFSYGSYIGQVYANLFPDRVRALALDGVIDPVAWAGTAATKKLPIEARVHSAEGASKALRTILQRCKRAGPDLCAFADGDPLANFDLVARRLRKHSVLLEDGESGEQQRFGYPDLVAAVVSALYFPDAGDAVTSLMAYLLEATAPPRAVSLQQRRRSTERAAALVGRLDERTRGAAAGRGFLYDNSAEAEAAVACTDSLNPAHLSAYPAAGVAADRRAPYFGRFWTWSLATCADDTYSGRDEDAYRGPFTRRPFEPLLMVGSYWDPAANYTGAKHAAALSPGSRLLSSDSWGHTSYGTSACVTGAVDGYLLRLQLPPVGKVCVGDDQPFSDG